MHNEAVLDPRTIGYSQFPYHLSVGVVAVWEKDGRPLVALGYHNIDAQLRLPTETPTMGESLDNTVSRLGIEELKAHLKVEHFIGSAKQLFFRPLDVERKFLPEGQSPSGSFTPCILKQEGKEMAVIEKSSIFFLAKVTEFLVQPVLEGQVYVTKGASDIVIEKTEVVIKWLPFEEVLKHMVNSNRLDEYRILRRASKLCGV